MKFLGSKIIETKRLTLRPTEKQDLKTLWEILCIPEVNKYYLTCKLNFDWEKELPWQIRKLQHAKDEDVFQWSIIKKEDKKCMGQISVQTGSTKDNTIRDIGWFIDPSEQRNGYAYEAASDIINYMFKEVEIKAIETGTAVENQASWKLMEKLGFSRRTDKTHITHYTFGGDKECYSYGITKEEYLNDGDITLRRLCNIESDYRFLEEWYKKEEIYSHFEQRILNYDEIVNKYYPRTKTNATVPVYMIEYKYEPVGIIQYQEINKENKELYKISNNNSYEMDIFIGNLDLHNKGIGKKAVNLMSKYLFDTHNAELIVMCPLEENINAIKCYQKSGFRLINKFTTNDTIGNLQVYALMVLEKGGNN